MDTTLAFYSIVILFLLLRNETVSRDSGNNTQKLYKNIQEAFPHMTKLIENSIALGNVTSVDVLGLTLYHMWEYLKNFTNEEKVKNLNILLTCIEGTEWQSEYMRTNWAEISKAFYDAVTQYKQGHLEELTRRKINIKVCRYTHIPMFHGILINGEHLFLSYTSWTAADSMEGGTTFFVYYDAGSELGKAHIDVFKAWLRHLDNAPTAIQGN